MTGANPCPLLYRDSNGPEEGFTIAGMDQELFVSLCIVALPSAETPAASLKSTASASKS